MGPRGARTALAVTAALVVALLPLAGPVAPASAVQSTASVDTLRTSWDSAEPGLRPAAVASSDFGGLFDATVDGQVYAQPLVQDSSVLVTTERARAYALDRLTGAVAWSRSFGAPFQATTIGCGDLVPDLGSTSTGVVDPATRTWYFTTKLAVGNSDAAWWLQGVSVDTGADRPGFPVRIAGSPDNDPATTFSAVTQMQRPGLLLLDGVVYAAFGAHCDVLPFKGYVVGVSTTTHAVTSMWTTAVGASLSGGGIWQGGGALVSDGPGRILLSTGNGFFGGSRSGTPGLLAESVVRLRVTGTGQLVTDDWFTPADARTLDANDTDLGSGAPTALPDAFGTAAHPHLMLVEGKDGRMFVLDRDDLGGYGTGPGGTDRIVSTTSDVGPLWGHPAFFGGGGGYAYVAPSGQPLRALAYGVESGTGVPRMTVVASSTGSFGYTSGSPVVTSDGTDPSSALVWIVYSGGANGADAELRAYDAVPSAGVLTLRWHAAIGTASKFSQPATDRGVVYVGTRDGHVLAFGRPQTTALASSPVELGATPVGVRVSGTATLTATTAVHVLDVSATAPFTVTRPATLPAMSSGDVLALGVAFQPGAAGDAVGQLVVTTDVGTFRTGLHGRGTQDGLASAPGAVAFADQPTGLPRMRSVVLTNTGATATTVSGVSGPGGAFSLSGPPAVGTVVAAGASITVGVTFDPGTVGPASSSFTVTSTTGAVTVPVSGTAVAGASQLSLSPPTLDFGVVPVGQSVSMGFDVADTGNLPLTVTKAKAPTAPFTADSPLGEGTVVGVDLSYRQDVRFTPTQAGFFTAYYEVTGDDGTGQHYVLLRGRATTPAAATAPSPVTGPGWRLNGASAVVGPSLVLTPAAPDAVGNAVLGTEVASAGLSVRFRTTVPAGSAGAEGVALGLLDPAAESPASLGQGGGGLGVGGLHGAAVTLDVHDDGPLEPARPFVGIVDDTSLTPGTPHYVRTSAVPGAVSHLVTVTYVRGVLHVDVDGTPSASAVVALPRTVLLSFSAATGPAGAAQSVRDVVVGRVPVTDTVHGTRGWRFNHGAFASGSWTTLNRAVRGVAGSVVLPSARSTSELTASFTLGIGGGTGGEGMTFALLDPASSTPASVGRAGAQLGAGGLAGTFVTFDTRRERGEPSSNFVSVSTGVRGGSLHRLAATTHVPGLRAGSHAVVVRTFDGRLSVRVDGRVVLDVVAPLPPRAYVAFTGSTGTATDAHRVARVVVSAVRSVAAPAVASSGWRRNGDAVVSRGAVRLTSARVGRRGTTFTRAVFPAAGLRLRYVATIVDGRGADGMALALVPATVADTAQGSPGGGVGWSGLGGVAVVSDTFANSGDPGRDFVGVATGTRGVADRLRYVAHSPPGHHLTYGTHVVDVAYVGGRLYVWVDGCLRMAPAVVLPPLLRVGFTASTGGLADSHTVSSVALTSW
ncbi:MAG: choice-of-anchor D domain-containing protein [Frankiales bacterium]|nr:choice-of-anchor D domain-containing protein [Frankiales bacterium]